MTHLQICHIGGQVFATAGFTDTIDQVAPWIRQTLADRFDCAESAIGIREDDVLTLNGMPVAILVRR